MMTYPSLLSIRSCPGPRYVWETCPFLNCVLRAFGWRPPFPGGQGLPLLSGSWPFPKQAVRPVFQPLRVHSALMSDARTQPRMQYAAEAAAARKAFREAAEETGILIGDVARVPIPRTDKRKR
jgi:hypothetical protein